MRSALQGRTAAFEGALALRGATRVFAHVRVTPLRAPEGHVVAALGIVEDVSQRVAAQMARESSEKRLSLHVAQNPLAVIFWNTRFEVIEWNEAATRMFGYTAEEVRGERPVDWLVPEPARGYVDEVWDKLLSGRGTHGTNANVTKDGRMILCEWHNTPLVDENNNVVGVASIVADVTERIRESEALQRSEARFRSLAELTPDGIRVIREARSLYVNPALARYLGYASPEELLALPVPRSCRAKRSRRPSAIGSCCATSGWSPRSSIAFVAKTACSSAAR